MVDQTFERRRSRASFTKTLEKICSRLTESPSAQGTWRDRFFNKEYVATVEALSLWVVGSFARGAPNCGDLDLVLDYKVVEGGDPNGRRAGQALFKSLPDVRVYGGTPTKNESGVAFTEAVLVWQGQEFDWKRVIASIPEDSGIERFSRPTDPIPFRTEQLAVDLEELAEIAEMEAQGLIRWTFTPISDLVAAAPDSDEELNLERLIKLFGGQKTQKLLPYLLSYFRQRGGWPKPQLRSGFEKTEFNIGAAKVLMGRPLLPIGELDSITLAELILVPHISARGPNGFWTIRRGPNHPLELKAKGLSAYHLIDEDGEPPIFNILSHRNWPGVSNHALAKGLDLFSSKRKAAAWAKTLLRDSEGEFRVVQAKRGELLNILAHLDVVFLDGDDIALTRLGSISLEDEAPKSSREIVELLSVSGS